MKPSPHRARLPSAPMPAPSRPAGATSQSPPALAGAVSLPDQDPDQATSPVCPAPGLGSTTPRLLAPGWRPTSAGGARRLRKGPLRCRPPWGRLVVLRAGEGTVHHWDNAPVLPTEGREGEMSASAAFSFSILPEKHIWGKSCDFLERSPSRAQVQGRFPACPMQILAAMGKSANAKHEGSGANNQTRLFPPPASQPSAGFYMILGSLGWPYRAKTSVTWQPG